MAEASLRRGSGRVLALLGQAAGSRFTSILVSALPIALPTLWLFWLATRAVLEKSGGVPAVPLDDAYIHFQYARSVAEARPFVFCTGGEPVGGSTSLLWPLVLSLGVGLGLHGHALIWQAWVLGFISLGLLAHEARRVTEPLAGPIASVGAAALVLAFGANLWFAASGMEVIPFAWLMLRAIRRSAEWCEGQGKARDRSARELLGLAWLLPLVRPEGAWPCFLIAMVLLLVPRGRSRAWALLGLFGLFLPSLIQYAFTHDFASTTARSKWLILSPYVTAASLRDTWLGYVGTLVGTLLNGEVWSAIFLPRGSAVFALASLTALPIAGVRRRLSARGLLLLALGLGILIPGTYDCPLCNRLRYLWPFIPAWFVGAALLCSLLGNALKRAFAGFPDTSGLLLGAMVGALFGYLPFSIDDLAASAAAIQNQQVSLGKWAREKLPRTARIGVNDTGAIAYFSERATFDVVGLTTRSEARYWTSGPGSRFEHYERLGPQRLPTHFIVYPEWFALDPLLGKELTERYVPGATILGGDRMVAYEADYSRLGSGEAPDATFSKGQPVLDRLDVADLESEAEHGYLLFEAAQRENVLVHSVERLDGARSERSVDAFSLHLQPRGTLVLRLASDADQTLDVRIGGRALSVWVPTSSWHEARLELPAELPAGRHPIRVSAGSGQFTSLHYFSLGPATP